MDNQLLPLGTIVKTKDDKICMISGYIYHNYNVVTDFHTVCDYSVLPYPCNIWSLDCGVECIRKIEKEVKKYSWYFNNGGGINYKDIKEVLFEGYKDEAFFQMSELLK